MRIDELLDSINKDKPITGIAFQTPDNIHLKGVANRTFESKEAYQQYCETHGIETEPATDNPDFLL